MRLLIAIGVGILVILICYFVGGLLVTTKLSPVVFIGDFLKTWAVLLGIVAGIFAFASGWNPIRPAV